MITLQYIELLDHKNIGQDSKIIMLSGLAQKLRLKKLVLQNGCQRKSLACIVHAKYSRF